MESKVTKDDFLQIAKTIVEFSNGKIRVAFNESDNYTKADKEAAHFLKLNDKRVGRDMEVYGFMSLFSAEQALPDFYELLIFIKAECPESYEKASAQLKELGQKVYEGSILNYWNELFD
jgi:hypothetical protein